MKFLIAGLGNPGVEYQNTRHNIGYQVLDSLIEDSGTSFSDKRYAWYAQIKYKGRILCLIKPTTYMNLSGRSIDYYMKKEKIPIENLIVIVDDIALPPGKIRIKAKGGSGGHNGLSHISDILGTDNYARLRFGIGDNYGYGSQSDFVLGEWTDEEKEIITPRIITAGDAIKSFSKLGIERTMNIYNNK
jgi:peptidyl-tRNA hydrolase, PTH1 family